MHLRATVFDMDGLLIDSEVLWHVAELEIFGELGVPLEEADRSTKGMYVDEVVRYWYGRYPWSGPTPDQVVARLLGRVGDLIEERGRLLPGAERAIEMARARGAVALASSTPRPLIHRALDHFGLREDFAVIRSADAEDFGKPHPAVFLSAARALDVAPTDCLVFEDSALGVIAARAARMRVVAVPAASDAALPEFALADLVLSSLADLDEPWLDEAFGR